MDNTQKHNMILRQNEQLKVQLESKIEKIRYILSTFSENELEWHLEGLETIDVPNIKEQHTYRALSDALMVLRCGYTDEEMRTSDILGYHGHWWAY